MYGCVLPGVSPLDWFEVKKLQIVHDHVLANDCTKSDIQSPCFHHLLHLHLSHLQICRMNQLRRHYPYRSHCPTPFFPISSLLGWLSPPTPMHSSLLPHAFVGFDQHNTTQHNTTQHNTTQHNTTQHNTTQHNTTQHNTHVRRHVGTVQVPTASAVMQSAFPACLMPGPSPTAASLHWMPMTFTKLLISTLV